MITEKVSVNHCGQKNGARKYNFVLACAIRAEKMEVGGHVCFSRFHVDPTEIFLLVYIICTFIDSLYLGTTWVQEII